MSVLCCGNELLYTELCVRTLCELVLHKDFYLQPSIVSILDPEGNEISKRALVATSARYDMAFTSTSSASCNSEMPKMVLRMDCLETPKDGVDSNMWHVYGLASVLNRTITSMYPEKNVGIRPLFNKIVHPRVQRSDQIGVPLIILWTRTIESCQQHNAWSPNHFVPCYVQNVVPSGTAIAHACTSSSVGSSTTLERQFGHSSQPRVCLHESKTSSTPVTQLTIQSGNVTPDQQQQPSVMQILTPSVKTSSIFHILSAKHVATGGHSRSGNSSTLGRFFQPTTSVAVSKSCSHSLDLQTVQGGSSFPSNSPPVPNMPTVPTNTCLSSVHKSIITCNSNSMPGGNFSSTSTTSLPITKKVSSPTSSSVTQRTAQKAHPTSISTSRILEATSECLTTCQRNKGNNLITRWIQPSCSKRKSVSESAYNFEGQHDFSKHSTICSPSRTYSLTISVPQEKDQSHLDIDVPTNEVSSQSDSEEDNLMTYSHCSDNDDEGESHQTEFESENMDTSVVIVHPQSELPHALPFPCVSFEWYAKQHYLYPRNIARERRRYSNTVDTDNEGNFTFIDRSRVEGNLEENMSSLRESVQQLDGNKQEHLQAILAVGDYIIIKNGPIVKTQEVGKIYLEHKGLARKKLSIEYYELFSKHLNVVQVQVYMFGTAFLLQNGTNVQNIVKCLGDAIVEEVVIKKKVERTLQDFKVALQYMDSHRDKQVIKGLIAELTNVSFVAKLQGIQSRKGIRNATKSLHSYLTSYANIRATSQIVRNDLTAMQQYKLTERIISA